MKYSVKITHPDGKYSYLRFRDRTAWSKRIAAKHAREFTEKHGLKSEIEPD